MTLFIIITVVVFVALMCSIAEDIKKKIWEDEK